MSETTRSAVVLLSGGVDSSTCLAIASAEGLRCHALSVRYGQRNIREIESARQVAAALRVARHEVLDLDLAWIGGSALTAPIPVPKSTDGLLPASAGGGVPTTYVPARNSVFLTVGAAWAEALGTDHIFIGVNRIDYSGYPDCRPDFIAAMERALRLGTQRPSLTIHAPLIDRSKAEIIRAGAALGLDYSMTWSCYDPVDGRACGRCDSCVHRRRGFTDAGIPDPTIYGP